VKFKTTLLFVSILLLLIITIACRGRASDNSIPGLDRGQQIYVVSDDDLVRGLSINGNIYYSGEQNLYFPSNGTIGEVGFEHIDPIRINKGDLIASLDQKTIATLTELVVIAENDLTVSRRELVVLENPETPLHILKLKADMIGAEATFAADNSNILSKNADIETNDASVITAKATLNKAISAVITAESSLEKAIFSAENKEKENNKFENEYKEELYKWFGISDSELQKLSPQKVYERLNIDINNIYDRTYRKQDILHYMDYGTLPSASQTEPKDYNDNIVLTWLSLYPGNVVGNCLDTQKFTDGHYCVHRDIQSAWDNYQEDYHTFNAQNAIVSSSISSVEVAQASVVAAEASLTKTKSKVIQGLSSLKSAEALKVKNQNSLNRAIELYEDELINLALDVSLLKVTILKRQAILDDAINNLDHSAIHAPYDGILKQTKIIKGMNINSGQVVAVITPKTDLEFRGSVSESEIMLINNSMAAEIDLDSINETDITGVVIKVSDIGNQDGVVTYPIVIKLNSDNKLELKEGLSGVARIILSTETNQVLVPLNTIINKGNESYIKVYSDEKVTERLVELGSNDEFWVSIIKGLVPGDTIVINSAFTSTNKFNLFDSEENQPPGNGEGGRRGNNGPR